MKVMLSEKTIEKAFGLFFVLVLHAVLLYTALSYQLISPPQEVATLFVSLTESLPKPKVVVPEPPKPPPRKVKLQKTPPVERPKPLPMLVAETPVVSPTDMVAEAPSAGPVALEPAPEPTPVVASHPAPQVASPIMMGSELSLACPNRTPPNYPTASRRMGEHGRVVLRVDLDETGKITTVRVKESAGYKRLDEAGVQAVKSWVCNAATRDGVPVRAVALQPFDFVLD